jgi:DNA-binding SARP family transcriptional activator
MLGPLRLHDCRRTISVGGPKQRTLLSLLLVRVNTMVSVDEMVDELWGVRVPDSAVHNIRLYIANLRRLLARVGATSIVNLRGSGYQLVAEPDRLDIEVFRRDVADARRAVADAEWDVALALFERGVGLWRGRALADVPVSAALSAWCAGADAERLGATEDLVGALIMAGFPDRAASRAGDVIAADPLRERAHALLMRARYQVGDVAGALAAFDAARRHMVRQLGVEPGDDLRRLQQAVLSREPVPAGPVRAVGRRWPAVHFDRPNGLLPLEVLPGPTVPPAHR